MKNMYTLEDTIQLTKQDITGEWFVVKPKIMHDMFRADSQTRENQVYKACSGFGCKEGSLSMSGGKVFCTNIRGYEEWFHRNEIMGIAKPHVLEELKVNVE